MRAYAREVAVHVGIALLGDEGHLLRATGGMVPARSDAGAMGLEERVNAIAKALVRPLDLINAPEGSCRKLQLCGGLQGYGTVLAKEPEQVVAGVERLVRIPAGKVVEDVAYAHVGVSRLVRYGRAVVCHHKVLDLHAQVAQLGGPLCSGLEECDQTLAVLCGVVFVCHGMSLSFEILEYMVWGE